MTKGPLITIAVPSYNQGRFLDKALTSLFSQELPIEVFVLDGGSTDNSVEIIEKWSHRLAGWRSHPDKGQAAAINEGIALGTAPYVGWLNSDDWVLPDGLSRLVTALTSAPLAPGAYGRAWNFLETKQTSHPVWVEPFNEHRLAKRCIISQPATVMKRSAWEAVGGVNKDLHMTMDYDLWWRLFKASGPLLFVDAFVAVNREHAATKTKTNRRLHYQEAIKVVRKHYGRVPLKWWIYQPYAVWFKALWG